jgi:hypothetical protein
MSVGYKNCLQKFERKIILRKLLNLVRFETVMAIARKTAVFWNIIPCNLVIGTNVSDKPSASIFRVPQ